MDYRELCCKLPNRWRAKLIWWGLQYLKIVLPGNEKFVIKIYPADRIELVDIIKD
jgi:hypothetical protein